ncbi:MAG: MFS transporter [Bacteroidia bacterium]|nr:MFS transporter [Bacteroidia bacterium]
MAFRNMDFRKFIFSKFLVTLALQIQFVVVSWQVYEITKDPLSLGLLGLSEAIPAIGLALYGGFVADRNDRRRVLAVVMLLQVLCSVAFLLITRHCESAGAHYCTALPFYTVQVFIGLLRGFFSPAQFSLMTQVVPRSAYANSSAWNSTFWHIAVVLGSSAGGLLLGYLGKTVTYGVVIVLGLGALIQMVRISPRPVERMEVQESISVAIRKGLGFVFSNQVILGAMTLDLIAVLFGGAIALLPVFASDVLMVGEKGFGLLRAAPFTGSVLMALYLTKHPPLRNAGKRLMICVSGFSLCMIAFALSKNFFLSLFILALSGAFDNVSVVIRSTILQFLTPDQMRGRVSSVSTMFISSSNEIGAFESGFAAKLLGLIPSVLFGGGVALASVFAIGTWMPKLRKLQLGHEVDANP